MRVAAQRRSGEAGQRVLAGSRPGGGFGFAALFPAGLLIRCSARETEGFFRAPSGRFRCAAFGGRNRRVPPRQAGRLLAHPRSRRKKGAQGDFRLGRPARATPGACYARRPISGLRAAFGGWPPKRGLRTAVAGAPPRDPGLSPLRGPGPAGRNFKRYPPGVPCHNPQTTAAPHGYTS